MSRRVAVNMLKDDGMWRWEISLRHMSLARENYQDKQIEKFNFTKGQSENILKNVANACNKLKS